MRALVFNTLKEAQDVSVEFDKALGYPKEGVDIGSGVHAPPEQSRTLRHADILPSKTGTTFALALDTALDSKKLEVSAKVGVPVDTEIDLKTFSATAVADDAPIEVMP